MLKLLTAVAIAMLMSGVYEDKQKEDANWHGVGYTNSVPVADGSDMMIFEAECFDDDNVAFPIYYVNNETLNDEQLSFMCEVEVEKNREFKKSN